MCVQKDLNIQLLGFASHLSQLAHGVGLLLVEGLQSVNFQLQGFLENSLFVLRGGFDLFTKVSNVGHDLLALDNEVLFNSVHVFLRDGLLSNSVGRDVGSESKIFSSVGGVGVSLGGTFFRSSNVNFVELESKSLALKEGKEPCGRADTGGLKEKGQLEEDVDNRVAQESNRELSSNQLPGDGSKDGGGKGSHESQVEHSLDGVRDTKDVGFVSDIHVDGGDTGDNEEAKSDSHLATAHESRKILATVAEQAVASLEGEAGRSTFGLGELGDGEESNLHTLEKTDAAHENDEEDEGDSIRKSFPCRGLSTVEGFDGDGKGEAQNGKREKNTSPEEGEG